ncbi:MAG: NADP-dependent oxidoreductase [Gammaproteobacteria bacterium]|nr:NADP-dependent oxidoreductase [Gammaproteobacteria bacterium]
MKNKQLVLAARPQGYPEATHFSSREVDVVGPPDNGLLIRNRFLSVEPAMRGWVCDLDNYLPPVAIGEVMRSLAVGEVVKSNCSGFRPGDYVSGWFGWQEYAAVSAEAVIRRVDPEDGPLQWNLGVLGLNGITAYLVLRNIGKPRDGETVLISTAAGAVGSLAGQLAARAGCRVVGLTGSADKVRQCVEDYGYAAAIDYKASNDLAADIRNACPQGVDVFLDNTGGEIADAALPAMNVNGRIIQCGTASIASWDPVPLGPRRERYILTKRLLQQGFVVFDHIDIWPQVIAELAAQIRAGELHFAEDIRQGIEQAPKALEDLYKGDNKGKLLVSL